MSLSARFYWPGGASRRDAATGAARLSLFIFGLILFSWIFGADHDPTFGEVGRFFFVCIGQALLVSGIVWILYIGLEPFVRRRLPDTIIAWNRALAGNFRDPLVARDVLIGILAGIALSFSLWTDEFVRLSTQAPTGFFFSMDSWLSARRLIANGFLNPMNAAVYMSLFFFFIHFGSNTPSACCGFYSIMRG